MSDKRYFCLIVFFWIGLTFPSPAQQPNFDVQQVATFYQKLDFDKAITTGENLIKSGHTYSREELIALYKYVALSYYSIAQIDSSTSRFLSLLSIAPDYELDPVEVSPKIVDFFNRLKERHRSETFREKTVPYTKYVFVEDIRPNAGLRSALLPGWGQFYKGQKKRGIIIGGLFLTSLAATGISLVQESAKHDDYRQSREPTEIEKNYNSYNNWYKRRKFFTVTTISIWAVGILDALFMPYDNLKLYAAANREIFLTLNIPLK